MADKPSNSIVAYAADDTTLESTGQSNKVIPTNAIQTTGLDKAQTFFVEHHNYSMNNFSTWLQYFEDKLDESGTSFEYDVQTSTSDDTSGSILLNGAFGLGSIAVAISDWDELLPTGVYRPTSEAAGTAATTQSGAVVLHVKSTAALYSQLCLESNGSTPRIYRRNYGAGAWGDWVTVWDNGNLQFATDSEATEGAETDSIMSPYGTYLHTQNALTEATQSSTTDDTAGKLLYNGSWGIGDVAVTTDTWADLEYTGVYRPDPSQVDSGESVPTTSTGSSVINIKSSGTYKQQIAFQGGTAASTESRTYRRSGSGGTWADWIMMYDEGNINEAYSPSAASATTQSVTLPNGLIMKFGVLSADDISATGSQNQAYTITFDTPFPNGVISPTVSTIYLRASVGGQKESMACISEYDVSSITVYNQWVGDSDGTFQGNDISWCVIGY